MKILRQLWNQKGLDAAVENEPEDRYGFSNIAENISQSILSLPQEASNVVGIEGAWGSGKTSLLNLILQNLALNKSEHTHVLHVSPWLSGSSPVEALFLPVATVIQQEMEKRHPPKGFKKLWHKYLLSSEAQKVIEYAQDASSRVLPLVQYIGQFSSIINWIAGGIKVFTDSRLAVDQKTTTRLRAEIAKQLVSLDLKFIVVMDDLDRLEPSQIAEVFRLVRAVADLPRFTHILCYDRQIITHAAEYALNIEDGSRYLQKIIQLSFKLPRPEAFDLRAEFRQRAETLYQQINNQPPDSGMARDLAAVTDTYGAALSTPREIHQAINSLIFLYPGIRDFVYFPDLCLLQLVRVTNPALYDWTEHYLTERSVIETGQGILSDREKADFREELLRCMKMLRTSNADSFLTLAEWIPGISGHNDEHLNLFEPVSEDFRHIQTTNKRLSSLTHWRYYFAFSSPQNVLPPEFFNQLFMQAGVPEKQQQLSEDLLSKINSVGSLSGTWFEHILSRLTPGLIKEHNFEECAGLVQFFFNHTDEVSTRFRIRNAWFSLRETGINQVVRHLLKHMMAIDEERTTTLLETFITRGTSPFWIADFMRELIWEHGLAQNEVSLASETLFSRDITERLRDRFAERMNQPELQQQLLLQQSILGYLYAWRDMGSVATVKQWVREMTSTDEGLVDLLIRLQTSVFSSDKGAYRRIARDQVSPFFDDWPAVEDKLRLMLSGNELTPKQEELKTALKNDD
ncbi:P-loop NTPase fold protein [Cronobacter sakazakii]|uniref:KAP family P-loop NTPase fold protein n=1 Tax=Cronobacter sakazakii TaxID=28141 RepID=UPI000DA1459C|nr:P-loop NTPase fold protein [Cronobacter sakazakii]EJK9926286.1 exclusion suppressor FxsA [Cronobacter sakazakii]ELY4057011.1 exclusion suppressor FxsA [Cronobacter sakazakii]ELY4218634.1 exclusion suppressor FxsA [Cronobacter sakazakii]ELY6153435.1 exclusion suppressor FxsA [Cronobacter sakazakii]ELY6389597.1 exclusion suppressor FxsA [Cronobacter sakazakii]